VIEYDVSTIRARTVQYEFVCDFLVNLTSAARIITYWW